MNFGYRSGLFSGDVIVSFHFVYQTNEEFSVGNICYLSNDIGGISVFEIINFYV